MSRRFKDLLIIDIIIVLISTIFGIEGISCGIVIAFFVDILVLHG